MSFEYPIAVRFRCTKCGLCCGDTPEKIRHIILLKTEAEHIARTTSQLISKFAVKTEGKALYTYEIKKVSENGKCVFLENNRCTIYSLRPLVCRFYPFEMKTTSPRKHKFTSTDECPGIGKGTILREENFRKLFRLARGRVKRERRLSETQSKD